MYCDTWELEYQIWSKEHFLFQVIQWARTYVKCNHSRALWILEYSGIVFNPESRDKSNEGIARWWNKKKDHQDQQEGKIELVLSITHESKQVLGQCPTRGARQSDPVLAYIQHQF
jgi:hypothetical protein